MHFLTLGGRVAVGQADIIEPGEYVVGDIFGAHLMVLANAGSMEKMATGPQKIDFEDGDYNGKSILFMRAGGFGDLVLLTPVLREVKRLWPDCTVSVSTLSHYAQVLRHLPFVDFLLPYPLKKDVALGFAGAVYMDGSVEHEKRATEIHMTEYFAELAGIARPADLLPAYNVTENERIWCKEAYPRTNGTRRVAVQVGTSAVCRVYPRAQISEVIGSLVKEGWEVMLLGVKNEIKTPGNPPKNLRNLSDADLTFRQSCAVVESSDAFLGSDSALLHVAGALSVPAVGLYGPFPWQIRTKHCPTTFALTGRGDCAPCFHHVNAPLKNHFPEKCPSKDKGFCQVLADIKPTTIVAKLEKIAKLAPVITV